MSKQQAFLIPAGGCVWSLVSQIGLDNCPGRLARREQGRDGCLGSRGVLEIKGI